MSSVAVPIPMPQVDAWLHRRQSEGGTCTTCGLLAWFEGPCPTLRELRGRVRTRWSGFERLRLMAATAPGGDSWPHWAPRAGDDMDQHVSAAPSAAVSATGELDAVVAGLVAQPLPSAGPPWRLLLLPRIGGFALLLLADHALLDGVSLMTLMRSLLDGDDSSARPPSGAGALETAARMPLADKARALVDLLPMARPLPFHGRVDSDRAVSWSELDGNEMEAARGALPSGRASTNAVLLSATAGALRELGAVGRAPLLPTACALVPVDVRGRSREGVLGNHYATVRLPFPLRGGPLQRLSAAVSRTARDELKRRARAQASLVDSRPRRRDLLNEVFGRYADSPYYSSLLCSSVRSHVERLALGPARMTGLSGIPPLSPKSPLAVTMTLYGPRCVVTVVSDRAHRAWGSRLAALIADDIRSLRP